MTVLVEQYSMPAFNSLPPLEIAGPRFDELNAKRIIEKELRPLFRKHQVENIFGLQLLHQHFKLDEGEMLVDFNGTAMPHRPENFDGSCWSPSVWAMGLVEDALHFQPLEFVLDSGIKDIDGTSVYSSENVIKIFEHLEEFFRNLHGILQMHNLEGLFGLARHPGVGYPGRVEITKGRANINLTPIQFVAGKTWEAAWFFDERFTQHGCRCLCPDFGTGHNGHNGHVVTQSG